MPEGRPDFELVLIGQMGGSGTKNGMIWERQENLNEWITKEESFIRRCMSPLWVL